jgi:hypothetical protein
LGLLRGVTRNLIVGHDEQVPEGLGGAASELAKKKKRRLHSSSAKKYLMERVRDGLNP